MAEDRLAGYRGPSAPGETAGEVDPAEALRARLPPDMREAVTLIEFGAAMERWVQEDPIGRYIYSHCQHQVAEAMQVFVSVPDLNSEKVKAAHFQARVGAAMLKLLDQAMLRGKEAAAAVMAADGSGEPTGEDTPNGDEETPDSGPSG